MLRNVHGALSFLLAAALSTACGGESSGGRPFGDDVDGGDASHGDSSGGASGNSGGKTGTGGASSSGGAATSGSGGAPVGSGGTSGDAGTCRPPANPLETALCINLQPEKITALADPALDKQGVLVVQIFDTPNPPNKDADTVALATVTRLSASLDDLPPIRAVAKMPSVVYVRAAFVDDPAQIGKDLIGYGTWFGGINLADGIDDHEPVAPVAVNVGEGNTTDLPLVALRRLRVKVHASATPLDDGQGPLTVVAVRDPDPTKKPKVQGVGALPCADVSKNDVLVDGFVVGSGKFWVAGVLDDYAVKGDLPPGSLASLNVTATSIRIPQSVDVATDAYSTNVNVDLSYVTPVDEDAGTLTPKSCAEILPTGADGGADGG